MLKTHLAFGRESHGRQRLGNHGSRMHALATPEQHTTQLMRPRRAGLVRRGDAPTLPPDPAGPHVPVVLTDNPDVGGLQPSVDRRLVVRGATVDLGFAGTAGQLVDVPDIAPLIVRAGDQKMPAWANKSHHGLMPGLQLPPQRPLNPQLIRGNGCVQSLSLFQGRWSSIA